ncbi:hypothetical protein CEXT_359131 [Caerostris extrusa]|uniref:Maturase K n=1 Tax=Caerostris extrusa TaxID=172846 RepID=A0AAV4XQX6_CAEEX|nr:hypothetical protein CEXT_359131 [Caerostris extrusa]
MNLRYQQCSFSALKTALIDSIIFRRDVEIIDFLLFQEDDQNFVFRDSVSGGIAEIMVLNRRRRCFLAMHLLKIVNYNLQGDMNSLRLFPIVGGSVKSLGPSSS